MLVLIIIITLFVLIDRALLRLHVLLREGAGQPNRHGATRFHRLGNMNESMCVVLFIESHLTVDYCCDIIMRLIHPSLFNFWFDL